MVAVNRPKQILQAIADELRASSGDTVITYGVAEGFVPYTYDLWETHTVNTMCASTARRIFISSPFDVLFNILCRKVNA